jgi:hypothetical protein
MKYYITETQLNVLLEQSINGTRIKNSDILYISRKQNVTRLFSRWFPIYVITLNNGTSAFLGVISSSRGMLDLLVISSLGEYDNKYVLDIDKSEPIASLEYVNGNVTYYIKPEYQNTDINSYIVNYTKKHLKFFISDLDEKEIED